MTRTSSFLAAVLLLVAAPVPARAECGLQFEVAGSAGMPVPTSRATRLADAGVCGFDVRVRPHDADACPAARVTVRGLATAGPDAGWQRVTLRARARRARRRVLRARMQAADGRRARARLRLRCAAAPRLAGCDDVLAESVSCFLGGGHRLRVAGLDSGRVCRASDEDGTDPLPALATRNLAVWEGQAYTCAGSAGGGFVATPVDGRQSRLVAGPCEAATTDGASLFVLPAPGFDEPPTRDAERAFGSMRRPDRRRLAAASTGPTGTGQIRAYELPEAVPAGPYEVAYDLATIPADSPCAGVRPDAMAARAGVLYVAGCRPTGDGCVPLPHVCVLGSAAGAFVTDSTGGAFVRPLELEDLAGRIQGMSALADGRLLVLAAGDTQLPPSGYQNADASAASTPCRECGVPGFADALHVFDAQTGARLDSRTLGTIGAIGLSCDVRDP